MHRRNKWLEALDFGNTHRPTLQKQSFKPCSVILMVEKIQFELIQKRINTQEFKFN